MLIYQHGVNLYVFMDVRIYLQTTPQISHPIQNMKAANAASIT